jgi:hypothetical protein
VFTETLTERLAVVGQIPPSNHAANTDTSVAGIDMSVLRRLITILDMGVGFGANANAQLYYRASAQANMNVTTNVAGAIPLTVNTNNRVATVEVRADQLPAGTRYVQPVLIINTAAANIGVICLGEDAGYKPGNQFTIVNTVSSQAVT